MGIAYNKLWRAKSWDRFAIPKPFSKGYMVWGPAVHVPRSITMETLEPYRLFAEQSIEAATNVAERLGGDGAPRSIALCRPAASRSRTGRQALPLPDPIHKQ
jgi:hypothetical protein